MVTKKVYAVLVEELALFKVLLHKEFALDHADAKSHSTLEWS